MTILAIACVFLFILFMCLWKWNMELSASIDHQYELLGDFKARIARMEANNNYKPMNKSEY